jgi:hypothetical protein
LDPANLISAGVTNAIIILSTIDYSTLKSHFSKAVITVWISKEPQKQPGKVPTIANNPNIEDLRPLAQIPVTITDVNSICVCANGKLNANGSLTFAPMTFTLPSAKVPISPQNPSESMRIIVRENRISQSQIRSYIELPMFVPASLNAAAGVDGGVTVSARAFEYRDDSFRVYLLEKDLRLFAICKEKKPMQFNGAVKFGQGCIHADLKQIGENIAVLLFIVYGSKNLGELAVKSGDAQPMTVFVNQSVEVMRRPHKYCLNKNAFLWFALVRDGFGGWGVINVSTALKGSEQWIVERFKGAVRVILRI